MTTTKEPETGSGGPTAHRPPRSAGRDNTWWRRPWIVPLAFVAIAFIAFSLPPYLGLDPGQSRVPPPPELGWYYPLLVAHIGFASVAMLTCVLQVWPWFRQRFPLTHRRIGRVYVFGGALPAGIAGLAISPFTTFGPVAAVSNTLMATLWLTCTVIGFRMARARRFADHRKWMIRSFVLTMSIISNRLWAVVWVIVLVPQLDTKYGGNEQLFGEVVAGITTWTGWVIPLLISQWWLERRTPRSPEARSTPTPATSAS